jgi:uncharacterized protein (DUF849 family)
MAPSNNTSVIVSCAVTGGSDTVSKNPAVPVTPRQIADQCIEAAEAGAAIVHVHVRDPQTTGPSMDVALYAEVVEYLRASATDVLINLTTGIGARFDPGDDDPAVAGPGSNFKRPDERVAHVLALRPDLCSLDMGTLNFGDRAFINTAAHLREMARLVTAAGVLPELEIFEPGHLRLALDMMTRDLLPRNAFFQLCLGIPWGSPADPETMLYLRNSLPPSAEWSAFGVGPKQFPMAAQAMLLGGNLRVGLEDNLYLERGVLAPGNGALVEKAVRILGELGASPASPAEARKRLGLS